MAFDPAKALAQATETVTTVVNGAKQEVEKVTTEIVTSVNPVVAALQDFQNRLGRLGGDAQGRLDQLMRDAFGRLGELAESFPDVVGEVRKFNAWVEITVDGRKTVVTEPAEIYTAIIAAVEPQNAHPPAKVEIRCGGTMLYPQLAPLALGKDKMRQALMARFGVDQAARVLVKNPADWVIACAIICFTICVLAIMAPPAMGIAAVLFCIGAALLVAVVIGYEVDIQADQTSAADITFGGMTFKSGPSVKMTLTRRS
jgi:hypothetical protein